MAERRMFAKSIINSGRFLRMPPTSRLLYYDLGMAADDDGVVEAYSVMTQTKATEDDLRVLVAKGFIKILNDDLVSFICDWNTNNTIRSDRYHKSVYSELLLQFTECQPTDNQLATIGIPSDNQMETEVRLDKVSISKDSIDKSNLKTRSNRDIGNSKGEAKASPTQKKSFIKPNLEEIKAYCNERRNNVDAERFFDYYESNGWKVGKNPMKDWKAAVRTWERNGFTAKETKTNGVSSGIVLTMGEDGFEYDQNGERYV